ncbi:hypothetical protein L9F63_027216, partial [Diploptera punctata]
GLLNARKNHEALALRQQLRLLLRRVVAVVGTTSWIFIRNKHDPYTPWGAQILDNPVEVLGGASLSLTTLVFPCYALLLAITLLVYIYEEMPGKLFVLMYLGLGSVLNAADGLVIIINFSNATSPSIMWLILSFLAFCNSAIMLFDAILTFTSNL